MKKLIVVFCLFVSTMAQAEQGDLWLQSSIVGQHLENNHYTNNFNPGIAVFYEVVNRVSVGYGVYRNSYQNTPRYINGKKTYPTLTSEALYLDYRFWENEIWETHLTYWEANHYYNASSSGTLVLGYQGMASASACRRFEEGSNWKACLALTAWHNNPGPGIGEGVTFRVQYNFGDITK
jgi:hypothetical protein